MMVKYKFLLVPVAIILAVFVALILIASAPQEFKLEYKSEVEVIESSEQHSYLNSITWKVALCAGDSTSVLDFRGAELKDSTTYIGKHVLNQLSQEQKQEREYAKSSEKVEGGYITDFYAEDFKEIEYRVIDTAEETTLEIYKFGKLVKSHALKGGKESSWVSIYPTKGDKDKVLFRVRDTYYMACGNGDLTIFKINERDLSMNNQTVIDGDNIYSVGIQYGRDDTNNGQVQYFLLVCYSGGKLVDKVEVKIPMVVPGEKIRFCIMNGEV